MQQVVGQCLRNWSRRHIASMGITKPWKCGRVVMQMLIGVLCIRCSLPQSRKGPHWVRRAMGQLRQIWSRGLPNWRRRWRLRRAITPTSWLAWARRAPRCVRSIYPILSFPLFLCPLIHPTFSLPSVLCPWRLRHAITPTSWPASARKSAKVCPLIHPIVSFPSILCPIIHSSHLPSPASFVCTFIPPFPVSLSAQARERADLLACLSQESAKVCSLAHPLPSSRFFAVGSEKLCVVVCFMYLLWSTCCGGVFGVRK